MSRGTSHSAGAAGPQPRGGSGSSALAKGGATLRKQLQPPLPVVPCVELTGTATSQNETTSSLRNHFWLSRPTVGLFKRSLEPIKSQYRGTSSPISNSRWGRSTADSRYAYKRRKCGGKSDEGPRGPISHIALEHTGAIGLRGRKPLACGADQSETAPPLRRNSPPSKILTATEKERFWLAALPICDPPNTGPAFGRDR
jgi:hypothetical protein